MNRMLGATMVVAVVFGIGTASANDGVLFRNMNEPNFTTPAEFLTLGQMNMELGKLNREMNKPVGIASGGEVRTESIPHLGQNDPARGALSGP